MCRELFVFGAKGTRNEIPYSEVPVDGDSLLSAHFTGFLPNRGNQWTRPKERGVKYVMKPGKKLANPSTRQSIRKLQKNKAKIVWNDRSHSIIESCAKMERADGNDQWLTDDVVQGYKDLVDRGYVYSVSIQDEAGNIVAGDFGMFSDGHMEGVSKFRDVHHSLSSGSGNVLEAAEILYVRSKGLEIIDHQVPLFAGSRKVKPGVDSVSRDKFYGMLKQLHSFEIELFPGADINRSLPVFESDLFEVRERMEERENYSLDHYFND